MRKIIIAAFLFLLLSIPLFSAEDQDEEPPYEFFNMMMPGFSGGFYYLLDSELIYAGGSFRFALLYGLDRNRPGAFFADRGRWEVYFDVGLYSNVTSGNYELIFNYVLGLITSFETPKTLFRDCFIPYIGLELGGIYFQEAGNGFMLCPILGLNLVSLPTFTWSIDCGFLLNTIAFEQFRSFCPQMNINFVL